jgi:hypothetical protein
MTEQQEKEVIMVDDKRLAIVVRKKEGGQPLSFYTPDDFPFQLGVHNRPAKEHIQAHKHVPFTNIQEMPAQEFFYIESGKVEVGIFHDDKPYKKVVLNQGDMMVLNCAHNVVFLEDSKMIEIKQGPYRGKEVEKQYIDE